MSSIVLAAVRNKKITLFGVLIAALYGFYSYHLIPKQEFPDIVAPIAVLITVYPGASPSDVEKLVTTKIEEAASEIEGRDFIRSWSRNSMSLVVLRLKVDRELDVDEAWRDLRIEMDNIESELPDGCFRTEIMTDLTETAGMLISLSGENYSYDQLVSFAEEFKRSLVNIDGITRFDIFGEQQKEIKVEVDHERLGQYGFSLEDIVTILKAQNLEIPSGRLENEGFKINVSTKGIFESIKDVENVIIDVSRETGAPVRLRDVANIRLGLEEDSFKILHNGQKAVLLAGYFEPSKNIVIIGKDVRKTLDEVKRRFPPDLIVDEVTYQPTEVHNSVSSFMTNLLEGVVLVIIVVFLGMGFRNALVVSSAVPISILLTFIVMGALEMKVHRISTCALIMALGMLVDNAIVIADAIQVRIDDGMERLKASFDGAVDSAIPVFTSTLTTVAAFFPLLMLPGPAGEFLVSIPKVIMIALTASYVVAMIVTPTMAALFFKKSKRRRNERNLVKRFFSGLLSWGLAKRKITIIAALGIFGFALYIMSLTDLRFFPNADKDVAYVDIRAETFDLDKVETLCKKVEAYLKAQKEIVKYTTAIGNGLPKFFLTAKNKIQSENFGQILFKFDLSQTNRFSSKEEMVLHFQNELDAQIYGGTATIELLQIGDPLDAPVVLRVGGENLEKIEHVTEQLRLEMAKIPGIINLQEDAPVKSYELVVDVDGEVATNMGISKYDVQRQINIALYGSKASVYRRSGKEFDIVVKSDIKTVEQLENFKIKSSVAGNKVLLKQIAKVGLGAQIDDIKRYQQERTITIVSNVKPGYSSPDIEDYIERKVLPRLDTQGIRLKFDGERERIKMNFGNVGVTSIFAMIAVYLILLVQFNSFTKPFVILLTIPLSLVGSVLGMFVIGQALSFTALLGIASLIGIVVNNAILLIEFIGRAKADDQSTENACKDAVSRRFRPIMLSTVTTVVGLMPLIFAKSAMFSPMAISLASGLVAATFLTMVVIPVIYATFDRN